jgi:hypothetical protein
VHLQQPFCHHYLSLVEDEEARCWSVVANSRFLPVTSQRTTTAPSQPTASQRASRQQQHGTTVAPYRTPTTHHPTGAGTTPRRGRKQNSSPRQPSPRAGDNGRATGITASEALWQPNAETCLA